MPPEREFTPDPESARDVRHFVGERVSIAPAADDVVLAASELAANAIRHARTDFTVRVTVVDEVVRLEVSDGSSIIPAIEELSDSSRGLRMIEAVSERWGIETRSNGKVIWVEFPLT